VYTPRQIANDLAGILFGQPARTPELDRKLTAAESTGLAGRYQFGKDFYKRDFTLEVKLKDGHLVSNYGELVPDQPMQFFQRSYWLKVGFDKDAAGKVHAIIIDGYRGEKVE
jgi:hypothetical protein